MIYGKLITAGFFVKNFIYDGKKEWTNYFCDLIVKRVKKKSLISHLAPVGGIRENTLNM